MFGWLWFTTLLLFLALMKQFVKNELEGTFQNKGKDITQPPPQFPLCCVYHRLLLSLAVSAVAVSSASKSASSPTTQ